MKNMLDHSSEPPKSSISLDFSNLSMKNELNAKVESLYLAIKNINSWNSATLIERATKPFVKRSLITSCLGIVLGICKVTA